MFNQKWTWHLFLGATGDVMFNQLDSAVGTTLIKTFQGWLQTERGRCMRAK